MHTKAVALSMVTALGLMLAAGPATAITAAERCQAGKNQEAGRYAACRHNAEAGRVKTHDTTKYNTAIIRCETKFAAGWQRLIAAAAAANATCPDLPLTGAEFHAAIDEDTDNIATALGGGGLADCSGDLTTCNSNLASALMCGNATVDGGEQCDQGNLNGANCVTQGFAGGTLKCGSNCTFSTSGCWAERFVDNGDGTVTDNQTGLMWEKKAALDHSYVFCTSSGMCPDPHDADNLYTWSTGTNNADGTAYTLFLAQLNAGGGFAGHTDWRLPTRHELETIIELANTTPPAVNGAFDTGCTASCTVSTCSCTVPDYYWSSSTYGQFQYSAWYVNFNQGFVYATTKTESLFVRAVRGGS